MKKNIIKIITYLITLSILITCIYFAYQYYQTNNFNDFIRSEKNLYTSKFQRDNETKYSQNKSYKIESKEYNDAMFFKKIELKENTPYKVTCMVKTNNVQAKEENTSRSGGTNIN